MGLSVLVVESDPAIARSLTEKFSVFFHDVQIAHSSKELRERVARSFPDAIVLNLEQSGLSEVRSLRREFRALPIVCLHRIADERLWIDALEAGATDVCYTDDAQSVLSAIMRSVAPAAKAAA